MSAQCRSCGAEIWWGEWEKTGKKMPGEFDPDGDLILVGGCWEKFNATIAWHLNEDRYVSHFATCPAASQHRRKS